MLIKLFCYIIIMVSEEALEDNIRQYWKYAEMAFENSDYNTSIIMHYKCMVACADLEIYREMSTIPSNHTKRFRVLEKRFPDFYKALDSNFGYYRDSYELEIKEKTAKKVRRDAQKIIGKAGIKPEED